MNMALSIDDLKDRYRNCKLSENDEMISKKQEYDIDRQLSDMYSYDYINNTFIYETEGYFVNVLFMEAPTDYNLVISNLLNRYRSKGWDIEINQENMSVWVFKSDKAFHRDETINKLLKEEDVVK